MTKKEPKKKLDTRVSIVLMSFFSTEAEIRNSRRKCSACFPSAMLVLLPFPPLIWPSLVIDTAVFLAAVNAPALDRHLQPPSRSVSLCSLCSCEACTSQTWASVTLGLYVMAYSSILLITTGLALRRDASQPKQPAIVILKMTFTYLQTIGHFSFLKAVIPGTRCEGVAAEALGLCCSGARQVGTRKVGGGRSTAGGWWLTDN